MFTLIALGVGVAYGYSVAARALQGIFPASFRDESGAVGVYFEVAAVIVTLMLLGQVLEMRARSSTNAAIRVLLGLAPNTARRVNADGSEEDVPLAKETTPEAIEALHHESIQIVMLMGDGDTTARAVAKRLGIDQVIAGVLPEQKAEKVKALQAEGRFVAMAGDGINDAPALAQAQVGIAMGTGTGVAMESVGVALVKGDLRGIVRARWLSRATMRNIKQYLFFAFIYNSLGVPVAAGVLYPLFGILLSPIIAAAAMSFSSVSVVGNALRLRRVAI